MKPIIIVIIVVIIIAIIFFPLKKKKKLEENLSKEENQNDKKNESHKSEEDFLKQNEGFIQDVTDLVCNDRYHSEEVKNLAIESLTLFLKNCYKKYSKINKSKAELLKEARNIGKLWQYEPKVITREKPESDGCEVISDCFSDIFPSTHDMDDCALSNALTDLCILEGITKEEVKEVVIHIKEVFVNHKKVSGVIWFDLYVPQNISEKSKLTLA